MTSQVIRKTPEHRDSLIFFSTLILRVEVHSKEVLLPNKQVSKRVKRRYQSLSFSFKFLEESFQARLLRRIVCVDECDYFSVLICKTF